MDASLKRRILAATALPLAAVLLARPIPLLRPPAPAEAPRERPAASEC